MAHRDHLSNVIGSRVICNHIGLMVPCITGWMNLVELFEANPARVAMALKDILELYQVQNARQTTREAALRALRVVTAFYHLDGSVVPEPDENPEVWLLSEEARVAAEQHNKRYMRTLSSMPMTEGERAVRHRVLSCPTPVPARLDHVLPTASIRRTTLAMLTHRPTFSRAVADLGKVSIDALCHAMDMERPASRLHLLYELVERHHLYQSGEAQTAHGVDMTLLARTHATSRDAINKPSDSFLGECVARASSRVLTDQYAAYSGRVAQPGWIADFVPPLDTEPPHPLSLVEVGKVRTHAEVWNTVQLMVNTELMKAPVARAVLQHFDAKRFGHTHAYVRTVWQWCYSDPEKFKLSDADNNLDFRAAMAALVPPRATHHDGDEHETRPHHPHLVDAIANVFPHFKHFHRAMRLRHCEGGVGPVHTAMDSAERTAFLAAQQLPEATLEALSGAELACPICLEPDLEPRVDTACGHPAPCRQCVRACSEGEEGRNILKACGICRTPARRYIEDVQRRAKMLRLPGLKPVILQDYRACQDVDGNDGTQEDARYNALDPEAMIEAQQSSLHLAAELDMRAARQQARRAHQCYKRRLDEIDAWFERRVRQRREAHPALFAQRALL